MRERESGGMLVCREETEIIEGEVVEVQIDRPTSASVSLTHRMWRQL